jgi:Transposase
MRMLKLESGQVIGGVDTHKDVHVAAVIDHHGQLVGTRSFDTTARGYRALSAWLSDHGEVVAAGVEGTSSWGAGLSRHLVAVGMRVVEVNRPDRSARRLRGKSDPLDAEAAARAVLAGTARATPKGGTGAVEAIRVLRVARRSAMKARIQAANQIRAMIDTASDELRAEFRDASTAQACAQLVRQRTRDESRLNAVTRKTLIRLAKRWTAPNAEIKDYDQDLTDLVTATAPALLTLPAGRRRRHRRGVARLGRRQPGPARKRGNLRRIVRGCAAAGIVGTNSATPTEPGAGVLISPLELAGQVRLFTASVRISQISFLPTPVHLPSGA